MKIILSILYFLKAATLSCHVDVEQGFERSRRHYKVKKIAHLPEQVNESSGLVYLNDSLIYTHNDSGGNSNIYLVNINGELKDSIPMNLTNKDWESIDYNPESQTLYIADIGNNRNQRKDLTVYAYDTDSQKVTSYALGYADQDSFPPAPDHKNFDCEAVAYHKGQLVLFSKNRGNRETKQYNLDLQNNQSEQKLEPMGKQLLHKQMVTAASVNPSGSVLALLTYGRIYLFKIDPKNPNLLSNPWRVIKCNRMRQSEGITFLNDDELIFSNEQGRLFKVTPK